MPAKVAFLTAACLPNSSLQACCKNVHGEDEGGSLLRWNSHDTNIITLRRNVYGITAVAFKVCKTSYNWLQQETSENKELCQRLKTNYSLGLVHFELQSCVKD